MRRERRSLLAASASPKGGSLFRKTEEQRKGQICKVAKGQILAPNPLKSPARGQNCKRCEGPLRDWEMTSGTRRGGDKRGSNPLKGLNRRRERSKRRQERATLTPSRQAHKGCAASSRQARYRARRSASRI